MAEEIMKGRDEILRDIESSLAKFAPDGQSGYRMTIHPDGLIEIVTGELARSSGRANPHYSCCCRCG
jgi:hypothetical protein